MPSDPRHLDLYSLLCNNREGKRGCGVCVYLKNSRPRKRWEIFEHPEIETLWITIRPPKLPIYTSNIICVCVCHPPQVNHNDLRLHLNKGLDDISSKHTSSGFLIIGDFNRFLDRYNTTPHRLCQIVKKTHTRRQYTRQVLYKH